MPLRKDGTYYQRPEPKSPPSYTASAPAPTPAPPPTVTVPGSPEWWKGQASSNPINTFTNALLPFMSPEDMKTIGSSLSTLPEYSGYKDAAYPTAPSSVTQEVRNQYLSSQRATNALTSLNNMRQLMGKSESELGPGYTYLTDVIKTLQRLGGTEGGMSREQYTEFQKSISDLSTQIQDNYDAQPYATLANYFVSPSFSSGSLMETRRIGDKTIYGRQNKQLFS